MIDVLEDERVKCTSIMTSISVRDYLDLVGTIYANKGGIDGQRAPLKTKTAVSIRKRMVSDLQMGAVIPPIVIGVLASKDERVDLKNLKTPDALLHALRQIDFSKISIIDG